MMSKNVRISVESYNPKAFKIEIFRNGEWLDITKDLLVQRLDVSVVGSACVVTATVQFSGINAVFDNTPLKGDLDLEQMVVDGVSFDRIERVKTLVDSIYNRKKECL